MQGQPFIDTLGKVLGQDLQLEDDTLTLLLDDVPLSMQWSSNNSVFHLQMSIGLLNTQDENPIFAKLLEANFLGFQTCGAFISYNEFSDEVFLERFIHAEQLDDQAFVRIIEAFVQLVDLWSLKLKTLSN